MNLISNSLKTQSTPSWTNNISNFNNKSNNTKNNDQKNKSNPSNSTEKSQKKIKKKKIIQKLKKRDRKVRNHEMAHKLTGGRYAGAVNYSYVTGPDNRKYAVGGSINIDTKPVPGEPKKTIKKAKQIKKAALAPAEPSQQDIQIANKASQMKINAKNKVQNNQSKSDKINNNLINKRTQTYESNITSKTKSYSKIS